MAKTIYLDHQATTPVDSTVWEEMLPYFIEEFGNPHSGDHAVGWKAAKAVERAAEDVAYLIGADRDEVFFTSGATEANNLAILGLGRHEAGGKRNRVLIGAIEHKCVISAARALQRQLGYTVAEIPVNADGNVNRSALADMLGDDVLLVSIMAVNNEIGTIEDIISLSDTVRGSGALFHCDAAQAPLAIDLGSMARHIDLLSLSAHKMYGPKGIGSLYVRREIHDRIEPLIYGGGQQRNLRSGTLPVPLCVGMGRAAYLIARGDPNARDQMRNRRDRLLSKLQALRWKITLNGPSPTSRHPGNLNIRFEGFSAADVLAAVQPRLAASTGAACSSGIPEPSHVLRAIGLSGDAAESSIRFSIGNATTDAELDETVEILDNALGRLAEDSQP